MCLPMWAHWRHLANTIEPVLPSATVHKPNGKSIGSAVSATHSSRQKVPLFYKGQPFPTKLPILIGDLDPHLIHDSLGKSEPTIQMASRSVQPFSHRWPQSVPILYNGRPLPPPSKLPLLMEGDLDPNLIHGSLGPEFSIQTATWSVQPFLQGSVVWQTDRQTTLFGQ